jgi:hypothetical protein
VGCWPWDEQTSRMAPKIGGRIIFIQFYYLSVWLVGMSDDDSDAFD